jgi:hypothetical protein
MNPLVAIAVNEAPLLIGYLKLLFKKANPDAPEPTDAEVIAAYESAFRSSVAKDDTWLAAHPNLS